MRIGDSFPKDNWRLSEDSSSCQILMGNLFMINADVGNNPINFVLGENEELVASRLKKATEREDRKSLLR